MVDNIPLRNIIMNSVYEIAQGVATESDKTLSENSLSQINEIDRILCAVLNIDINSAPDY